MCLRRPPSNCLPHSESWTSSEAEAWNLSLLEFPDRRGLTNTYCLLSQWWKQSYLLLPLVKTGSMCIKGGHPGAPMVTLLWLQKWATQWLGSVSPSSPSIYRVLTLTQPWARPCRAATNKTGTISPLRQVIIGREMCFTKHTLVYTEEKKRVP